MLLLGVVVQPADAHLVAGLQAEAHAPRGRGAEAHVALAALAPVEVAGGLDLVPRPDREHLSGCMLEGVVIPVDRASRAVAASAAEEVVVHGDAMSVHVLEVIEHIDGLLEVVGARARAGGLQLAEPHPSAGHVHAAEGHRGIGQLQDSRVVPALRAGDEEPDAGVVKAVVAVQVPVVVVYVQGNRHDARVVYFGRGRCIWRRDGEASLVWHREAFGAFDPCKDCGG
mmetsp:Transcript_48660/g.140990  ORF Transcript_48660/g.140990 Transcript_48660/m.140990 type:complete len:227 (-) Transcript_48660:860-1540(-)